MIWIELLGPSGVGKSYIFKDLSERKLVNEPALCSSDSRFQHTKVGRNILRRKHTCRFNAFSPEYNVRDQETIASFMSGLPLYTENPGVQLNMCNYFHYKFKEYLFLQAVLPEKEIFFSEDGILHLNYGINENNVGSVHMPKLIISLTASSEYIVKNRLERIKDGGSNYIERSFTEKELVKKIFPKNLEHYNFKTNVLRNHLKERFFEIDVENNDITAISEQVEEILRWIRNWE